TSSLDMVTTVDGIRTRMGAGFADVEHARGSIGTLGDPDPAAARTEDVSLELPTDRHAPGFDHASASRNAARYAPPDIDAFAIQGDIQTLQCDPHEWLHAALALRRRERRAGHEVACHACHDVPGQLEPYARHAQGKRLRGGAGIHAFPGTGRPRLDGR